MIRSRQATSRNERRGVAMLLVIIALVVTTILAAAALTSRDNSPAIGANASNTTKAQWSAVSGALFVTAAIEQNAEELAQRLANLEVDPEFISNLAVAGGNIRVSVTRPDGTPYEEGDRLLLLTATGSVEGIEVDISKLVMLPSQLDAVEALNLSHNEFAIFATNSLDISNGARLGNWKLSPEFAAKTPVKVGVAIESPSLLTMPSNPSLGAVSLYLTANATSALQSITDALGLNATHNLPIEYPAVVQSLPADLAALYDSNAPNFSVSSGNANTPTTNALKNVSISSATMVLDGDQHSAYAIEKISASNNAAIRIRGDVRLYVHENLRLSETRVVLDPGASLQLYLGDGLRLRSGSMLGLRTGETGTNWASIDNYVFPDRIRIFQVAGATQGILLENNTTLIGCIYAPQSSVAVFSGAAIIGRITAADVTLNTGSRLLYDPRLDSFAGLTTLTGPLYKSDGTPITGLVAALTSSLDAECLEDMTTLATDSLRQVMHSGEIVLEGAELLDGGGSIGGTVGGVIGGGLGVLGL